MREEVAIKEWCLEKSLELKHMMSPSDFIDAAKEFEKYVLDLPETKPKQEIRWVCARCGGGLVGATTDEDGLTVEHVSCPSCDKNV